jgi:hypothetical protein
MRKTAGILLALLPMALHAESPSTQLKATVSPEVRPSDAMPFSETGPVDTIAIRRWLRDLDGLAVRFRATGLVFDNRALEVRINSGYVNFKLRAPSAQAPKPFLDYGAIVAVPVDRRRWKSGGLMALGVGAVFERASPLGKFRADGFALVHAYRHAAPENDGSPLAEMQLRLSWETVLPDERFTLAVPVYFGWLEPRDSGAKWRLEAWVAPALRFRAGKGVTFAAAYTTANLFQDNRLDFGNALRTGTFLGTTSFDL